MSVALEHVATAHYHLPREVWWSVPIEDHTLAIDAIDVVTCEVRAKSGLSGFGYTYTLTHGGSAVHTLLADEFAPHILGRTIDRPEPIWDELWSRSLRYGRGGVASVALAAADVALWDILSKDAGIPLYRYLGAFRDSVPVYGSSIDLGYGLDQLLDTVGEWVDRGFGAVKVKVGRSLPEDLKRLTAVRNAIGPDIELMVDANNGWDLAEAGRRIAAMQPFDLSWVEEPLVPDDVSGHASLQLQSGMAIAAGETLFSVADFQRYLVAGAIRYVQTDVGRVGGITPWIAVAQLAAIHHVPVAPHFMHDLHVHLLCAIPNSYRLEYLPLLDAIMEHPLTVTGGHASPREAPGHGIGLKLDVIEPYLVSDSIVKL